MKKSLFLGACLAVLVGGCGSPVQDERDLPPDPRVSVPESMSGAFTVVRMPHQVGTYDMGHAIVKRQSDGALFPVWVIPYRPLTVLDTVYLVEVTSVSSVPDRVVSDTHMFVVR